MKKYIKGFDKDLKCLGFQFEIGKEYDTGASDDSLELCSNTVFHFCESIQQVHRYYDCRNETNRYCEIEALGKVIEESDKCGSNKIRIVREIKGAELARLLGKVNGNTGLLNIGDRNTGNRNTGGWNTGDWNTGDRNTGNRNTGDCNTGDRNIGDWNTGDRNNGNCNTGYRNKGDCNTGDWNTGDRNTGNCNTGDRNTGDWNKCDCSTGFFNTKERTITIFNVDSGLTYEQCKKTDWFCVLCEKYQFNLTEWIWYTEEEKKNSPIRQAIEGYMKKYTFEEACANWWSQFSEEDKAIVQTIPNFDKEIFKEITGIEVEE